MHTTFKVKEFIILRNNRNYEMISSILDAKVGHILILMNEKDNKVFDVEKSGAMKFNPCYTKSLQ